MFLFAYCRIARSINRQGSIYIFKLFFIKIYLGGEDVSIVYFIRHGFIIKMIKLCIFNEILMSFSPYLGFLPNLIITI